MLRLRTILLYNWLYYVSLIIVLLISVIRLSIPYKSIYEEGEYKLYGIVDDYAIDKDKVTITLKSNEKLLLNYYFHDSSEKENFSLKLGDYIYTQATLSLPSKNSSKYLFNYRKYLTRKKIYYIGTIIKYKKISNNRNIYYKIRESINNYLKDDPYLNTFIIGNKRYLSKEITSAFQSNGTSHLLALSGMHIGIFSSVILFLLKKIKIKENKRYFIVCIFLIIYLLITNVSTSILRAVLFFILFSINKVYYFYIKPINIGIVSLIICLLINPNYIFDIGFLYSFIVSFSLILGSNYINSSNNYIIRLFKVSLISFIVSLPITIYNFYSINCLSIIYNLIFVPLVSLIVFPLALITFFIPIIKPLFYLVISILEFLSLSLSKIRIDIIFPRVNIIFYFSYYVVLLFTYYFKRKVIFLLFIVLLIVHYFSYLKNDNFVEAIDVGQGDSTLLSVNRNTILIDTGGILKSNKSISEDITIPILKSLGIRKIETIIITHGDFDHMGEAINLVNNFKVEKVIFNCGEYNNLEVELIKVLDKKKIKYYSCIQELNIDKNKLYFLQTKVYDNENDNSNVIYTELNGYKFMFMGDAGVTTEKEILDKYNLPDIDVLKVGHHGSKTSSGKEFIDKINPKYSIISVGKNNRYGHPNKEVLDNLKDTKIYRTDIEGSIMFKVKNNKLKIETCSP